MTDQITNLSLRAERSNPVYAENQIASSGKSALLAMTDQNEKYPSVPVQILRYSLLQRFAVRKIPMPDRPGRDHPQYSPPHNQKCDRDDGSGFKLLFHDSSKLCCDGFEYLRCKILIFGWGLSFILYRKIYSIFYSQRICTGDQLFV
jgi:hypothetical protein